MAREKFFSLFSFTNFEGTPELYSTFQNFLKFYIFIKNLLKINKIILLTLKIYKIYLLLFKKIIFVKIMIIWSFIAGYMDKY